MLDVLQVEGLVPAEGQDPARGAHHDVGAAALHHLLVLLDADPAEEHGRLHGVEVLAEPLVLLVDLKGKLSEGGGGRKGRRECGGGSGKEGVGRRKRGEGRKGRREWGEGRGEEGVGRREWGGGSVWRRECVEEGVCGEGSVEEGVGRREKGEKGVGRREKGEEGVGRERGRREGEEEAGRREEQGGGSGEEGAGREESGKGVEVNGRSGRGDVATTHLVWHMTRTLTWLSTGSSCCRVAMTKTAVLPIPLLAWHTTSMPRIA